jgi:nucleotide-binding universal stress UspA family protein
MTLKNILMHMDATDQCEERLKLAGDLALRHDAHLSGLFVMPETFYPIQGDRAYFPQEVIDNWEKEEKKNAEKVEKTFQEFVDAKGIHGEWRSEQGPLRRIVSLHARYADLTIVSMGNTENSKKYIDPFLAEDVVMESGRPVLVVPNAGHFDGFGKRVLVCWNASREAVRAINDSMSLLRLADKVTVLVVNPEKPSSGDHGDIPSADIALHLARHGVKAEATSVRSNQSSVGEIILSRAVDADADMIVAGAYGHSETREWLFGGVTNTLLHETTVPTFLSH